MRFQVIAYVALAVHQATCRPAPTATPFLNETASLSTLSDPYPSHHLSTSTQTAKTEQARPTSMPEEHPKGWVNYTRLEALPANASKACLQFQPLLDFADTSCYNVPAVDREGNLDAGLPKDDDSTAGTLQCRDKSALIKANNNVYCRRRCNNGWCAYMYDYYFPKDVTSQAPPLEFPDHTYEWENVVVWTRDPNVINGDLQPEDREVDHYTGSFLKLEDWEPAYVTTPHWGWKSYFYGTPQNSLWVGTHPTILYNTTVDGHLHKPIRSMSHTIQNASKRWVQGALVEYNGFPQGVRDKMLEQNWGKAKVGFKDGEFEERLYWASPEDIWGIFNPTYDVYEYPFVPQHAE